MAVVHIEHAPEATRGHLGTVVCQREPRRKADSLSNTQHATQTRPGCGGARSTPPSLPVEFSPAARPASPRHRGLHPLLPSRGPATGSTAHRVPSRCRFGSSASGSSARAPKISRCWGGRSRRRKPGRPPRGTRSRRASVRPAALLGTRSVAPAPTAMSYRYDFDHTSVGDIRLAHRQYKILHRRVVSLMARWHTADFCRIDPRTDRPGRWRNAGNGGFDHHGSASSRAATGACLEGGSRLR